VICHDRILGICSPTKKYPGPLLKKIKKSLINVLKETANKSTARKDNQEGRRMIERQNIILWYMKYKFKEKLLVNL
jgi:hypothetical protein